jgi:hypothetical protein
LSRRYAIEHRQYLGGVSRLSPGKPGRLGIVYDLLDIWPVQNRAVYEPPDIGPLRNIDCDRLWGRHRVLKVGASALSDDNGRQRRSTETICELIASGASDFFDEGDFSMSLSSFCRIGLSENTTAHWP